jgi:peptidyl-prolyl cis-trans isomerase B (cyclophilin B)
VLQCGDPTGTGSGGPGYQFHDELSGSEKYTRGVLAMANAGANTNGSQFFIVYKDSQLPPNYTVFGTVSKGLAVVDKVAAKGSNPAGDGKPKLPISLRTVTVAK